MKGRLWWERGGGGSWTMRGALWAPRHREVVVAVWGRWGIVKHLRFLFLLEEAVQVLLGGHEFGVERGQVGKDIFGFFS